MKVLLIRMDRLGDLVCTLPVDQHPQLAQCEVEWLISKGLEPVLDLADPKRNYIAMSGKFSWKAWLVLIRELRIKDFDKVILFYAPWWIGLACLLAGIPDRSSPRSRWYQLLFFNKTLKQKRSRSEKHEAEYNWDLTHWSFSGEPSSKITTPILKLANYVAPPVPLPPSYVVLHPGMGGSALNWPPSYYVQLARLLVDGGDTVLISGTPADQPWLKEIEQTLRQMHNVHWMVGQFSLQQLIYVLGKSKATIAPSTGVLHLAASTGVKTIGIYSPIRVQTPKRWSPRGLHAKAIAPSVECPATNRCLESQCKNFPCMNAISPEQLFTEISN